MLARTDVGSPPAAPPGLTPFTRTSLTFVAGFCDTATFVHLGGVFSAHVTGNFVLFSAALAQGIGAEDYIKIATFPFFVLGVMLATLLYGRAATGTDNARKLLWLLTAILALCAAIAASLGLSQGQIHLGAVDVALTFALVVALAAQNTIHHFVPGPMTTVMTGTVMNTTAALTERYLSARAMARAAGPGPAPVSAIWMIASFAFGCLLAAILTLQIGLASVAVPAAWMIWVMIRSDRKEKT